MPRGKELPIVWMIIWFLVFSVVLAEEADSPFVVYDFREADIFVDGMASTADGPLRLTDDSQGATGHAFLNRPIRFRTGSFSFSTEFVFGIFPERSSSYGQGMGFLVSPTKDLKSGAASYFLGIFNKTNDNRTDNHIFAVEFDTQQNHEALDVSDNHVGINVNSIVSVTYANASYYDDNAEVNRTLVLGSERRIHTWIEYDGEERLLNVTLAPFGIPKPSRPLVSIHVELSKVFKEQMYFGFSGSTSAVTSYQYVLGWTLAVGGKAERLDEFKVLDLHLRPPRTPPPVLSTGKIILISIISAIVLMTVPSGSIYVYFKYKYVEEDLENWEEEYSPQRYAFRTLYRATRGFKENRVLGQGGFGKVFRGDMPDGTQIAVKRIADNSRQGIKEYFSEIATMSRLSHRNVVQLLGYCRLKGEMLLVYEYLVNGSVSAYLSHGNSLSWSQRVNIVKGAATALHYLHEGWDQVVLHRDVKASNVLLDADLNAKLGDFGLARFQDRGGMAQENTCPAGTDGYMAPELTTMGGATKMMDVYAFGAFLLELVCGRRVVDNGRPGDEAYLVNWVANCGRRGRLMEDAIDSRLVGNFGDEEAMMLLKIGMICSQNNPEDRPSMRDILEYLDGNASAPEFSFHTEEHGNVLAATSSTGTLDTVTVLYSGR